MRKHLWAARFGHPCSVYITCPLGLWRRYACELMPSFTISRQFIHASLYIHSPGSGYCALHMGMKLKKTEPAVFCIVYLHGFLQSMFIIIKVAFETFWVINQCLSWRYNIKECTVLVADDYGDAIQLPPSILGKEACYETGEGGHWLVAEVRVGWSIWQGM